MKIIQGPLEDMMTELMKIYFREVLIVRPTAAMSESEAKTELEKLARSSEAYLLAKGYMQSDSQELRKIKQMREEMRGATTKEDEARVKKKWEEEGEEMKKQILEEAEKCMKKRCKIDSRNWRR